MAWTISMSWSTGTGGMSEDVGNKLHALLTVSDSIVEPTGRLKVSKQAQF